MDFSSLGIAPRQSLEQYALEDLALSRAQTSAGLFLRGRGVNISANKKAVDFYKRHCK